uniref:Uncharacterized protein n=1 Tax=Onchocerca volvulus TaxID=6282 RepID=A0A8R1TRV9_ONCVO
MFVDSVVPATSSSSRQEEEEASIKESAILVTASFPAVDEDCEIGLMIYYYRASGRLLDIFKPFNAACFQGVDE